ncbi:MAG: DUF2811 domain-containing protein [Cyanobacteria bacterium J06554_6]
MTQYSLTPVPNPGSPTAIALQVELPEDLHAVLQEYLSAHPGRDLNNVAQVAISLFLQQNGPSSRAVSGLYLDGLFGEVVDEQAS